MLTPVLPARLLPLTCGLLVLTATIAAAQPAPEQPPPPADLAMLRSELSSLRAEVAALRGALADIRDAVRPKGVPTDTDAPELRPGPIEFGHAVATTRDNAAQLGAASGPAARPQQPVAPQIAQVTPEMLDLLKAQLDEHAQTKVESASRMPVKLSGTILTNTYVNSAQANWLENPNVVSTPAADTVARGSMSATARQSRIGLEVGGITVGGWQASGTLIADFYGGTPGFPTGTAMGLPRLLYAFGRIENERTAIEIGQDHVILAPLDPTSLAAFAFPLLFRSGNLYLRAPQARIEQKLAHGWSLATGIVAPLAGDASSTYEFAPPAGAGERSMRPAFESRLGFARGSGDTERELAAGVSGHYGWRRTGDVQSDAWALALDLNVRAGRFGASGEWYAADNAEPFGGGISQPGRASGSWAEGRVALTSLAKITAGFGRDHPEDALGRVLRQENRTAFSNVIFQLTPEVAASLEYRWMETRSGLVPLARTNQHVNAVFAVKF